MKKAMNVCFIVTVVFILATSAVAENKAKTFSLTPFIGGYTFEGNEDLKTRPVYGLRFGYDITKEWGIEGSFDYVRTSYTPNNTSADVNVYGYRVEALYNFLPEGKLVPFVAVGVGGRSTDYDNVPNNRNYLLADYGAGLKYFLSDTIALRADIRHLILNNDTTHNLEYTVGLTFYFGGSKAAPTPLPEPPPPPKPQPRVEQPALPAPNNLMATAISDSQINLGWNAVAGATEYKVYRDGAYVLSSQTTTMPDRGLKAGTRYCYRVTATDGTGRESVQSNQACATTSAPPVVMEQSPKEAVRAVAKEMLEKGRATIDIEFDFDKADVKPKYHDEIKKFADVMKDYPDLKVVIEGHTDSIGGKAYNEKLSLRRANSIIKYMVDKFGIDASRLTAKGYGMSRPIADNKTAAGRQKNRRVEAAVDYMIKK
jgi:OOP family OmpA-OmpF porin